MQFFSMRRFHRHKTANIIIVACSEKDISARVYQDDDHETAAPLMCCTYIRINNNINILI